MKPIFLTIGIILFIFGVYPPFHLMTFIISLICLVIGIFGKKKEKKNEFRH